MELNIFLLEQKIGKNYCEIPKMISKIIIHSNFHGKTFST